MDERAERFESSLKSFDPYLDVRDGVHMHKYVIERRAYISQMEIGFLKARTDRLWRFINKEQDERKKEKLRQTFAGVAEELRSAQAGKRVVLFVDELDPRIFNALALSDLRRYGGYSRFADELERQEKEREAQAEREVQSLREDLNREAFNKLQFAFKHKDTKLAHYDGRQSLTDILR